MGNTMDGLDDTWSQMTMIRRRRWVVVVVAADAVVDVVVDDDDNPSCDLCGCNGGG